MQAGMFATANAFASSPCDGVFTHFRREEDRSMEKGKLEEEMIRMKEIARRLASSSLLLCNESFSSTNMREGSEIAGQITCALVEHRIRTIFVTHLTDFALDSQENMPDKILFLRAERNAHGRRTFRLNEGLPLETGFALDLFEEVFENAIPASNHRHEAHKNA